VIQLFLSLFLEVKPEVQLLSRLEMLSQGKPISIRKCNNMRSRLDAGARALSSEVDAGSREENASKQKAGVRL